MRSCPHCGNTLVAGQKICDACGEYIFDTNQPIRPTRAIHEPKPEPVEPIETQQYHSADDLSPSQYRTRFIGLCALCLGIIIVGTLIGMKFFGFI